MRRAVAGPLFVALSVISCNWHRKTERSNIVEGGGQPPQAVEGIPVGSVRGSFEVEGDTRLMFVRGSERTIVIDLERKLPAERFHGTESLELFVQLSVAAQGDFADDGTMSAIIGLSLGSACPGPSYLMVTASKAGLRISPEFASCTNGDLKVSHAGGRYEFSVRTEKAALVFGVRHGDVVVLGQHASASLQPIAELRQVDVEKKGSQVTIDRDLDGDGKADRIACVAIQYLSCSITNADGTDMGSGLMAPGRIGVLSSTTKGHLDIVVGRDTIVRWNGKAYD